MCSNKNIIVRQFTSKFYQRQFSNKNHHQVQHLNIDLYAVTLVDPSATNNTVINFVLVAGVVKTDAKHAYPPHRYPCFFSSFSSFRFLCSHLAPWPGPHQVIHPSVPVHTPTTAQRNSRTATNAMSKWSLYHFNCPLASLPFASVFFLFHLSRYNT